MLKKFNLRLIPSLTGEHSYVKAIKLNTILDVFVIFTC